MAVARKKRTVGSIPRRKTSVSAKTTNAFLGAIYKGDTVTENGAVSNSTTGNFLVDQFGKAGSYRGRDINSVFADQGTIWGEDKLQSLRFIFYLRLITRKIKGFVNSEKIQMGQGVKDEAFKRLLWVAKYHPDVFYKNMWLIPVVGSWKDLFTLIYTDNELKTHALNQDLIFELIQKGIDDPYNKALVQKYLPQVKSNAKCKTERAKNFNQVAKDLCEYFGWSAKEYRKFKATGAAHNFQRLLCAKLYDNINWNEIPGKALFNLVSGKFLSKHNLENNYTNWLEKQPVAKFTGYVYELVDKIIPSGTSMASLSAVMKNTYDKQFKGLIDLAKKNRGGLKGNVWVACDTSGSMSAGVAGTTAYNIAISLSVYFAELNEGAFHNNTIIFQSTSYVLKLSGTSFVDRIRQIAEASTDMGGTNFESVVNEIVKVRKKNPNIPISDYPDTLIVVSDMQFNPSTRHGQTNYETFMKKLAEVGLPPIKMIWWDCTGRVKNFPSTIDDLGTYVISGFDGSIITLLCGGEKVMDEKTGKMREKTMIEKMDEALSQEVFLQIGL